MSLLPQAMECIIHGKVMSLPGKLLCPLCNCKQPPSTDENVYLPSREEIKEKCEEIQKTWTPAQRLKRLAEKQDPITVIRVPSKNPRVERSNMGKD